MAQISAVDERPPPRLTYTVPEAAAILGISRGLAYEMVHAGTLPALRLGSRILIPRAALEATVNSPVSGGQR